MDWSAVTAIAAIATAISTTTIAAPIVWRGVCLPLLAWFRKNAVYNHLAIYDRDILRALRDTETTQISAGYDDSLPSIDTILDRVLSARVACRLKVSAHYHQNLDHLSKHGLLEEESMPWDVISRYDPSQRYVKAYRLTTDGERFIRKYAVGLHRGERFIRRWLKGLDKHKCKGRFRDEIGTDARSKLPNLLRGKAWLKKYQSGAKSLGTDQLIRVSIYEYPPGTRKDGVECMVEIPLSNLDVAENDRAILAVDTSSKPQHLKFNRKVAEATDAYWVEAVVVGIVKNSDPVGTVLNLQRTREFNPSLENSRVLS